MKQMALVEEKHKVTVASRAVLLLACLGLELKSVSAVALDEL